MFKCVEWRLELHEGQTGKKYVKYNNKMSLAVQILDIAWCRDARETTTSVHFGDYPCVKFYYNSWLLHRERDLAWNTFQSFTFFEFLISSAPRVKKKEL